MNPCRICLPTIKSDYVYEITDPNNFFNLFAKILDMTFYIHPTSEMSLKSETFTWFVFFRINTMNELFTPLTILPFEWNSVITLMNSSLMSSQNSFTKPKLTPSSLGLLELSQAYTALCTSSSENSRTKSYASVLLRTLKFKLVGIGLTLTPIAAKWLWKWSTTALFISSTPHNLLPLNIL